MLERLNGLIVWHCDECGQELHTLEEDFDHARRHLKNAGWRTVKDDDEWKHRCPDCQEDGDGR